MMDSFLLYGLGASLGGLCGLLILLDSHKIITTKTLFGSICYSIINALAATSLTQHLLPGQVHITVFACIVMSLGGEKLAKALPQLFYTWLRKRLRMIDDSGDNSDEGYDNDNDQA